MMARCAWKLLKVQVTGSRGRWGIQAVFDDGRMLFRRWVYVYTSLKPDQIYVSEDRDEARFYLALKTRLADGIKIPISNEEQTAIEEFQPLGPMEKLAPRPLAKGLGTA